MGILKQYFKVVYILSQFEKKKKATLFNSNATWTKHTLEYTEETVQRNVEFSIL